MSAVFVKLSPVLRSGVCI